MMDSSATAAAAARTPLYPTAAAYPPTPVAATAPPVYPVASAYPSMGAAYPAPPQAVSEAMPTAQDTFTMLSQSDGVVIRQDTEMLESCLQCFFLPYVNERTYRVAPLPPKTTVASDPYDLNRWQPTGVELENMEKPVTLSEESNLCARMCTTFFGMGQTRPMTTRITGPPASNQQGSVILKRPFRLGGSLCCPYEQTLYTVPAGQSEEAAAMGTGSAVGMVKEDFEDYGDKCYQCCCLCTSYTDVMPVPAPGMAPVKRFTVRANTWCCGRVSNFCGASCLKNDAVYDILDADGHIVSHVQKTYGPGSSSFLGSLSRWCCLFSNYLVQFPPTATPQERALLVAAVQQVDLTTSDHNGRNYGPSGSEIVRAAIMK